MADTQSRKTMQKTEGQKPEQTLLEIEVPEAIERIISSLENAGYQAFLVGGCVRDSLLGLTPKDFDLTTSAKPEEVISLFERTVPTGIKHGTVTVIEDGNPVEVTTFRTESDYADHRHPGQVHFASTIEEDLSRRDLTINAMAWSEKTGLKDPFGGQTDLKNRLIRAVGDPDVRFEEDALRMFRAYRFAARLHGTIDPKTEQAIHHQAHLTKVLAVERVVPEVEEILDTDPWMIARMLDVLHPFLPQLEAMKNTPQNTPYHYADVLGHTFDTLKFLDIRNQTTLWAALLHDAGKVEVRTTDENGRDHFKHHEQASARIAKKILADLKLPVKVQKEAVRLILDHDTFYAPRLENLYKLRVIKGYDDRLVQWLFALQKADIRAHAMQERMETLQKFIDFYEQEKDRHPWSVRDLKINGKDVAELTALQGAERAEALREVLHQVIVQPGKDTREAQLALLKSIAGKLEGHAKAGSKQGKQGRNC